MGLGNYPKRPNQTHTLSLSLWQHLLKDGKIKKPKVKGTLTPNMNEKKWQQPGFYLHLIRPTKSCDRQEPGLPTYCPLHCSSYSIQTFCEWQKFTEHFHFSIWWFSLCLMHVSIWFCYESTVTSPVPSLWILSMSIIQGVHFIFRSTYLNKLKIIYCIMVGLSFQYVHLLTFRLWTRSGTIELLHHFGFVLNARLILGYAVHIFEPLMQNMQGFVLVDANH